MESASQGQSEEVRAYLRYKMEGCDFEMCIDPDKGYIPFCGVCRDMYEKYKVSGGETCGMEHSEACLWYEYFWSKIRDINPDVTVKRASAPTNPTAKAPPVKAPPVKAPPVKAPPVKAPPVKAPVQAPSKLPVKGK